ncbi:MAG TPA: acyltransferase [Tepidisphaeraceae bacterium]|nr:acyltransferase [Tepidisphaeraceae bacterium]
MRIIAAIHVVLFHYGLGLVHQSTDQYIAATRHSAAPLHWTAYILGHGITNIIAAGSWSVSLFFILSGFILFYNYGDDRENSLDAKKFWIARFARIYPVYLVGILVMAPFLFHRWAVDPRFTTHKIVTGGVLSLAMLQSWFPRHYATLFNGPGWSMSVEAFCYALFPLLLLPLRRVARSSALIAVIAVCWIIAMVKGPIIWICIRNWWVSNGGPDNPAAIGAITDYTPLFRLPEFIAGMALGRLMLLRGGPAIRGARLSFLTLGAVAASLFFASLGSHCPWFLAASGGMIPLFLIVIWTLTVDESFLARLLAWSPLVFLGEASYAVYILHEPIDHWGGTLVNRITHHPVTRTMFDIPNYWVLMLYLAVVLGVCSLVYRYFEMPARDRIRRELNRRSQPQPAASSVVPQLDPPFEISDPVTP